MRTLAELALVPITVLTVIGCGPSPVEARWKPCACCGESMIAVAHIRYTSEVCEECSTKEIVGCSHAPSPDRIADEHDAVLIFDEVQCGFGLTGDDHLPIHYKPREDERAAYHRPRWPDLCRAALQAGSRCRPGHAGELRPLLHPQVTGRLVLELAKTLINSPTGDIERSLANG